MKYLLVLLLLIGYTSIYLIASLGQPTSEKSENTSEYDFKFTSTRAGPYRYENKEVICYQNSYGLQCKFKGK